MSRSIIILAGGKGTRLGDLTKTTPKPMLEVAGKPFLWWLVQHYRKQGFTNFTISTGYLAEQIEAYDFGPAVEFEQDSSPGGHERYFNDYWSRNFIVNGDTWIEAPLPESTDPLIVTDARAIDAGAQIPGIGKIKVHKVDFFIDIGTPEGYDRIKHYAYYKGWHYDPNQNSPKD